MILVTGASGFLGQHLVRQLSRQGKTIRAIYHKNSPTEVLQQLPGVHWQQCDLLDLFAVEEILNGIDAIYHCAAIVSFHPADKERMLHFNVESTVNIVNEALVQNVRKMVFVSSVAALGRNENNKDITEEEQWEESSYNSNYGLSKHLSEIEVWRGVAEGLDAVIVNPTIMLGAGNWNEGSARLMTVVNKEFPFYTEGINGWVDVEDVVEAMTQLMESEITGERFILCEGNYAYKEIFSQMADALNKRPPHIKATKLMTSMVWRWNLLKSILFGAAITVTKETAKTAQRRTYYDNSKLKMYLPQFQYTTMQSTIERMAKAFKEDEIKKN